MLYEVSTRPKRRFHDAAHLPQCPQLRMVRIDGSLFFGAVSHVSERLREMERKDRVRRNLVITSYSIHYTKLYEAVIQGVVLKLVFVNYQLNVLSWLLSTHDKQLEP